MRAEDDLHTRQLALASSIFHAMPEHVAGTRLAVYRTLVRASLREAVTSILPRTAARMGDRFDEELDAFYAAVGPKTHYLRDVPLELVAWAAGRWEADASLPPFLVDLARHEVAELEVAASADDVRPAVAELVLDRPAVFAEAVRLARYGFAVHQLPLDEDDRSEPEARDVWLLLYRDEEHQLRYLELTPAAAAIVGRMLAGETTEAALRGGAADAGVAFDDALLAGTARLLGDLAERGVLLGSAA